MKLAIYSDLHLEYNRNITIPNDLNADVIILAGDCTNYSCTHRIKEFLNGWNKPVLYVLGNHEYYNLSRSWYDPILDMDDVKVKFLNDLYDDVPNLQIMGNQSIIIDDVSFYGGTMWTNFNNSNPLDMLQARDYMNDFRVIYEFTPNGRRILTPEDTVKFHQEYVKGLELWLDRKHDGKRVVISHHAPTYNPMTKYSTSKLQPAFNSLDMEKYFGSMDLWIYGHTHEADDRIIGDMRIISNPLGYPNENVNDFDIYGKMVEV